MNDSEEWREVPSFEGLYLVSTLGRVKSFQRKTPRFLSLCRDADGYYNMVLCKNGMKHNKKVHTLVLEAFVGPCPSGHQGCHSNGIRTDNRLTNLRWGTPSENAADRTAHGNSPRGEQNNNSSYSAGDVDRIRDLSNHRMTYKTIAEWLCLKRSNVQNIATRKTWAHL